MWRRKKEREKEKKREREKEMPWRITKEGGKKRRKCYSNIFTIFLQ